LRSTGTVGDDRHPGGRWDGARQRLLGRRKTAMDDLIKSLMFVAALYGAYHSARKVWQLGTQLLG
jgi:hypothetical protein